jgi:hypothetical protein
MPRYLTIRTVPHAESATHDLALAATIVADVAPLLMLRAMPDVLGAVAGCGDTERGDSKRLEA